VLIRDDEQGMRAALREAEAAAENDEVPVGCVIVHDGTIVGRGRNQTEALQDATAHAEIVAIGAASSTLGSWRLVDCTLYVTLEPCAMCVGAMVHARLARVVYGARDPKTGACGSIVDLPAISQWNHHGAFEGGLLEVECGEILKGFFAARRR
jgi:tRNA(adenine34) deaminase